MIGTPLRPPSRQRDFGWLSMIYPQIICWRRRWESQDKSWTSSRINMLIDRMATMARLDQEKRVERIKQGLDNKHATDPEWKPSGKRRNAKLWDKVKADSAKHPNMSAEDLATLAKCGVATIYRIKHELKA